MIFLDNASTTITDKRCADTALRYMTEKFYNPSAPYHPSVTVSNEINRCRENILRLLKGEGKIVFTSSGTESDNTAIFGSKKTKGSRIVLSDSEHPAVKKCAETLISQGYEVVFAPVDEAGRVIYEEFIKALNVNTSFVSVMHVNNETGAVNDIKKLCNAAKKINPSVIFHSDGVQAVGKIKVNLKELGVDLYSFSGHKIHAPKGIAGLYIKKGVNIKPYLIGGGQEYALRSSTENVPGIMAFNEALTIQYNSYNDNYEQISALRNFLVSSLDKEKIKLISTGECSPYIIMFALKKVRGEVMLHSLEKYEIYIGTGSACSSKKSDKIQSYSLYLSDEYKKGLIRVSLSRFTTKDDIDYFIKSLNLEYDNLIKYI